MRFNFYAYVLLLSSMSNNQQNIDDERVRDHLANERTFLAWLRTGVAAMGLGVVIARLRYILGVSLPESTDVKQATYIGLVFALVGIMTIVFSAISFLKTREEIRSRSYVSQTRLVLSLAVAMTILGLFILWYLMHPIGR